MSANQSKVVILATELGAIRRSRIAERRIKMLNDMNAVIREELEFIEYMLDKIEEVECNEELYGKWTSKGLQYYSRVRERGDGKGKSKSVKLGDEKVAEVIDIKQRKYNSELRRRLEFNKKLLERVKDRFLDYDIDDVDAGLEAIYRDETGMVNKDPAFMDSREWERAPYKGNDFAMPLNGSVAIDGRRVRSKSEVIIYDQLKFFNVPFRYDADVNIKNEVGERVYKNADFVIWAMPREADEERVLVWEHLGRLDDERYFENSMHKVRLYVRNGYVLGNDLILTADSNMGAINAKEIYRIIKSAVLPRVGAARM